MNASWNLKWSPNVGQQLTIYFNSLLHKEKIGGLNLVLPVILCEGCAFLRARVAARNALRDYCKASRAEGKSNHSTNYQSFL